MHSKHLHIGPGGIKCACCMPPPGSPARKAAFRRAKRRESREAIATELEAMADEQAARCVSCGNWIEEGETGPHCIMCWHYRQDYEAMLQDEYEREIADHDRFFD